MLPQPPPPLEHLPSLTENGHDDRRELPARKMDVDENYDEDGDDEKRVGGSGGRNSPQRSILNGQPKIESQG